MRIELNWCREKVKIPFDKPYILLKGENKRRTQIVWDDIGPVDQSATFISAAPSITVKSITFAVRFLSVCFNWWTKLAFKFEEKVSVNFNKKNKRESVKCKLGNANQNFFLIGEQIYSPLLVIIFRPALTVEIHRTDINLMVVSRLVLLLLIYFIFPLTLVLIEKVTLP